MKYEYACEYGERQEYEGEYEYGCKTKEEYAIEVVCCRLHEVEWKNL